MSTTRYLTGALYMAGDIELAESGDPVPGVVVSIARDVLRAVPTLPMYQQVAIVPVDDLAQLRADLARVAAERDELLLENGRIAANSAKLTIENMELGHDRDSLLLQSERAEENRTAQLRADLSALRARVAELEADAKKFPRELAGKAKRMEQRNAELEAECDKLKASKSRLQEMIRDIEEVWGSEMTRYLNDKEDAESLALARAESATSAVIKDSLTTEPATPGLRADNPMAESVMGGLPRYEGEMLATPAKHPDREDDYGCDEPLGATFARAELRAIDAARKQGGAHD